MGRAAFLLKLLDKRIIERFPIYIENGLFFMMKFADIFKNMHFCVKQDIDLARYRNSQLEVLLKCWQNL